MIGCKYMIHSKLTGFEPAVSNSNVQIKVQQALHCNPGELVGTRAGLDA